jgi:hypothetical protein
MNCPSCTKEVEDNWIYCHYCGTKLRETNLDDTYSRFLGMHKSEEERRASLDSKSATYIGMTSVVVTVLLAVAKLLFGSSADVQGNHESLVSILFVLYVCAVVGFTLSAASAFRAYHVGSAFMSSNKVMQLLNRFFGHSLETDVYQIVNPDRLLQLLDYSPEDAKRELIGIYHRVWKTNYNLNNQKSDRILICYALSSISLVIISFSVIITLVFLV